MEKRGRKSVIFYIVIVLIILALLVAGFFIYNSLKGKTQIPSEGESGAAEEVPSREENVGVIEQIKNIFTGSNKSRKSGGGGSGGGSGGSSSGGTGDTSEGTEFSTDKTVCQNAQDNALCDGLDVAYGGDYKTLCCSQHSLCC